MWDDLVSTAVIGTTAQAPPLGAESEGLSAILVGLNADDREAGLLAAAGLTAQWRLAGSRPPIDKRPLPQPSDREAAPAINRRASHYLERMLGGQVPDALPEFLEAVASAGKILPPDLLPNMLDTARGNELVRPFLPTVAGRRGAWLAAQNSLWRDLTAVPNESAWETGTSADRAALISRLRATNPGKAIELLRSTWSQESPNDRSAFLSLLSEGLSQGDESFLEEALSDSRIEVRRAATGLLARLPGSRLSGEVTAIAFSVVELKSRILGKARIDITITDDVQGKLKAARIELEPAHGASAKSLGDKAKVLYQLVSITPVVAWTQRFEKSPERLIEAASDSDWSKVLIGGWTSAIGLHPHTEWTRALIQYYLAPRTPDEKAVSFPGTAIAALPSDTAEALITMSLAHGTIVGDHPALWLTSAYPGPWSEALSRTIVKTARRHVGTIETYQMTILDALSRCALKMPPGLATEFGSGWPIESGASDRTVKLIDEFVSVLTFRRDMLQAIQSEDQR
ncbi:MAG TPA: DUF5691 domain-containing protein [Blastocatellia bacterium]|nr:DUF5691 domain-containing protein [Blastocatellia bacterium]